MLREWVRYFSDRRPAAIADERSEIAARGRCTAACSWTLRM
ncbi:MAG: hypothetical protein ACLRVN_07240 [Butyricicoccus sp.]